MRAWDALLISMADGPHRLKPVTQPVTPPETRPEELAQATP
jgi:hypothetical protein